MEPMGKSSTRARLRGFLWFVLWFVCSSRGVEASGITLHPQNGGWFRTNFKYMVDGVAPEDVKIPIPYYVIRHPEGVVLFDSGMGTRYRDYVRSSWMHRLNQLILPETIQRDQAAVEQIKKLGIRPEEVRFIVMSHLHYDHAGGLQDFPRATVVVSRGEWENAGVGPLQAKLRGVMKEQLQGIENRLWLVDYQPGTAIKPFDASFDLMGDHSLVLLMTPGHTPGHQSLLVTLGSGRQVLLAGDAVWTRENYEKPAPKGWLIRHLEEDNDEAWETTLKFHEFHKLYPEVEIIPGHDPHLWKQLPQEFR